MTKKEIILALVIFIVVFLTLAFVVSIVILSNTKIPTNTTSTSIQEATPSGPLKEDIPTKGNSSVYLTNSETRIRVVNEYDKNMFTAKKNLLIMFGSWCPNCREEILEIESIIHEYKDNKDVKIIVIAHEFIDNDYPLSDIISLVENDVNYGDFEVLVDFERVIRGTIDPKANTVPISYVVDKNGNILNKYESSLTLDKANELLK